MLYIGRAHFHMSYDEIMLMPYGLFWDMWEAHRQYLGWAQPLVETDAGELYRI
jgi:hypothetical protein